MDAHERLAYKVTKAAELLDVSRATIYNLISSGELASVMIGGSRRIPASELDRVTQPRKRG